MTRKPSSRQRRKHERIEEEFHRSPRRVADIEAADSVSLATYQNLQETLAMLRRRRTDAGREDRNGVNARHAAFEAEDLSPTISGVHPLVLPAAGPPPLELGAAAPRDRP